MTELLRTPADWPTILLGRAKAKDPTDLDAAVAAGAFAGLRRAIRDLGPTAVIAACETHAHGSAEIVEDEGAGAEPRRGALLALRPA